MLWQGDEVPECAICGYSSDWLEEHVRTSHGMDLEAYVDAHPAAEVISSALLARWPRSQLPKSHPSLAMSMVIAGVSFPVHTDVPADACLPMPEHYREPTHGLLAQAVARVVVALARGRSCYVSGPAGCGKDALFHAWSARTRTPAVIFHVEPGADIRSWFFSHEFDGAGTFWQEGEFLRAARDGYQTATGRRVPYLILISDFDRATKEQAEAFRLVLDSISGRVKGAAGVTHPVLAGTRIIVTANTSGGGDTRGRYVSANVLDASILDRFDRAFQFHWLAWEDEEVILREKFPLLVARCPSSFVQVGKATAALRSAIAREDLYADFSHRALCAWLGEASDVIAVTDKVPPDLLGRAFAAYSDRLPDEETRTAAGKLVDPHIGNTLPKR